MPSDDQAVTIAVDDTELAAIFERIARAIPGTVTPDGEFTPRELLRTYARLLEEGASVGLTTRVPLVPDPEVG